MMLSARTSRRRGRVVVVLLQWLFVAVAAAFPWTKKDPSDPAPEPVDAPHRGGRRDLASQLLSSLGLRADPVTLSLLAGLASLLAVSLRQAALSAAAAVRSALRRALYVEITVSKSEDARLYKALVRWMQQRGLLDRVQRYKAVSTTPHEGGGGRGGGGKGGRGGGGGTKAPPSSFHSTAAVEILPSAALDTHRFTYRGSWCWAEVGGGDHGGGGLALIGSLRNGAARRMARQAARKDAYITLSALGFGAGAKEGARSDEERRGEDEEGSLGGSKNTRGIDTLRALLQEALDEAARADQRYLEVWELTSGGADAPPRWDLSSLARKRPASSVILREGQMEDLVADVGRFIADEDWHLSHNVPHRRGYLLHGPPGNGKSSVVAAIASHFSLPLAIVPLSRLGEHGAVGVGEILSSAPPCSVLVLEDVDAAFSHGVLRRDLGGTGGDAAPPVAPGSAGGGAASLSELLNALDGAGAQAGRLVFMTTNAPGSLDDALVRPGRCDRVLELGDADATMATRLFASFFHEVPDQGLVARLSPRFGAAVTRDKSYSMAALQGLLVRTRGDPQAAFDAAIKGDFGNSR